MEDLKQSKRERSKAKQQVTVTSRQLMRGIQRNGDRSKIEDTYADLERVYADFIILDDEYRNIVDSDVSYEDYKVVEGMDLDKYTEHVVNMYDEAIIAYNDYLDVQEQNQMKQAALPLKHMIDAYMDRCSRVMKRVDDTLHSGILDESLSYDCSEMENTVMQMTELMGKLMAVQSSDHYSSLQMAVQELCVEVEEKRRVVFLRNRQHTMMPPPPLKPLNTVGSILEQDAIDHTDAMPSDIRYESLVGDTTTTSHASEFPPSHQTVESTSCSNGIHYSDSVGACVTVAPEESNAYSSWPGQHVYPSSLHSAYTSNSVGLISIGSQPRPIMSTTVNSSSYAPGFTSIHPSVSLTQPPFSHSVISYYAGNGVASSIGRSVGHGATSVHGIHSIGPARVPAFNAMNSISMPPGIMGPIPGPSMMHGGSVPMPPLTSTVNTYARLPMNAKVEKIALPKFSGKRRDWPEFKAVWKKLAEGSFSDPFALATELKRAVKGTAAEDRIKSVSVTRPEAYDFMWRKLNAHYDNAGAIVSEALEALSYLQPVKDKDYQGLIHLVDEVESCFSQLGDVGGLNHVSVLEVDKVNDLLPTHIRTEWIDKFRDLPTDAQLYPFLYFMSFLERHRDTVIRLAERDNKYDDKSTGQSFHGQSDIDDKRFSGSTKRKFFMCAVHCREGFKHATSECTDFKKLEYKKKLEALRNINACFRCFGDHMKYQCQNKTPCTNCGKNNHHLLLCKYDKQVDDTQHRDGSHEMTNENNNIPSVSGDSNKVRAVGFSLYAIMEASVLGTDKTATTFCDDGSDTAYITHSAAQKLNARSIGKYTLDVTTMGNVQTTYKTKEYEISIRTQSGKIRKVVAFGMDKITGPVSTLDEKVLKRLFPNYDVSLLQRKSTSVDLLLGSNYFGLHPKHEIVSVGDNLSVMQGELGVCLQGAHPELFERTTVDSNMVKLLHGIHIQSESHNVRGDYHNEFVCPSLGIEKPLIVRSVTHTTRSRETLVNNFIQGEEIGTEINPRCGGCKCSKCPIVGHSYSFNEEQELKLIQRNLKYDKLNECWITDYPWIMDPRKLPDNFRAAYATLKSTERTLLKDDKWSETYMEQVQDMVNRKVARKLTDSEISSWKGPCFYLSTLAVSNPRSNTTPVRMVFNSSQVYQGVSLNSALAKGPDAYLNNLLGLLLRWREESIALVGDIRKMFNAVHINILEQHCHRFLWRNMERGRDPDIYVMTRVNMGDRPAGAISTEALYKTADLFSDDSNRAAQIIKNNTYVDDILDSLRVDQAEALKVAQEVESMLWKGGFHVKYWQFSGESFTRVSNELHDVNIIKEDSQQEDILILNSDVNDHARVLGTAWKPLEDTLIYKVSLNFSRKRKGVHIGPDLHVTDIPKMIPSSLTRRMVLSQVMRIYDPLGILCPFTLRAKVYLRETWALKLGWDETLPDCMYRRWIQFFSQMYEIEQLSYPRCLHPPNTVGDPWLIILSDGSDIAYGFTAYIRWQLDTGVFWCRLIMAKCRIAPLTKLTTPQMELNAAVLSKRGRKVIEKETRFKFGKILQIVDSETVLSMIKKLSHRFKVYYGVRLGEIQAATDGDVSCWAWLAGSENIADWTTRGKTPQEIDSNSQWWNGPSVLYSPFEKWGLRTDAQQENLPGEKKVLQSEVNVVHTVRSLVNYSSFSSFKTVVWVIARVLNMIRMKTFTGGNVSQITPNLLRLAENVIIKDVQTSITADMNRKSSRGKQCGLYTRLHPMKDNSGIWIVGSRLVRYNPMTPDNQPQKLMPSKHPVTELLMGDAHKDCKHRGRDSTLARFRQIYWTPHGSKMAWSIVTKCQLCKLRNVKLMEQSMGLLPMSRLKPSPPFNHVMLDLFGPYKVRGEVQKRTSGKAYGVIFTDLTMRAVHIDVVFGYDTTSFLIAFSRFTSIRGYPEKIFSDPGAQLIGADNELKNVWSNMDTAAMIRKGAENGMTWIFGPADSPWHQGAVEALVKSAKRAINISIHNQRLSVPEILTLFYEVANVLNERPIGALPGADSELSMLTPNSLLLGRATAKNPGGWQPQEASNTSRYNLIQTLVDTFWSQWTQLCAPSLVLHPKWHTSKRNLKPGDVVLVVDSSVLRSEYRLGIVRQVYPGQDHKVRQVLLSYKMYKVGENVAQYSGAKDQLVTRSVQRLVLIVPVDEDT